MNRRRLAASLLGVVLVASACSHPAAIHRPRHAPPLTQPAPVPASLVATAQVPSVPAFATPGASKPFLTFSNPSILEPDYPSTSPREPLVFLVRAAQPGWLEVSLPHRPNGATGWIRASDVSLVNDSYKMVISLGAHHLGVLNQGRVVDQASVAVGASSGPTPTGSFYVTELIACNATSGQPCSVSGPYGPGAFGLSGYSNVYSSFSGGNGQIAMHGTNQPFLIGNNVSHGCVRLANADMNRLMHEIPVGTPVDITA